MRGTMRAAAIASILAAASGQATAQSTYGCTDLAGRHVVPSIEGKAGVFYRIEPDLRAFHPFADEVVSDLARLSRALAENGTTLVYVPLPTKSLAMPAFLTGEALDYGFDIDIATTNFVDVIHRLEAANVATADIRSAIRANGGDDMPFFQTDPRLTPAGARIAAQAIGERIARTPGFDQLPRGGYVSAPGPRRILPSPHRDRLQKRCSSELPKVEASTWTTTLSAPAASASGGSAIFGARKQNARIALVGADNVAEAALNLGGFLSEFTGLEVVHYGVPNGGAFAAISSYLTSQAFHEARPAFLVWVNPIENSLARFGDQPLAELTAAASGNCRLPVPILSADIHSLQADIRRLDPTQPLTLFLDTDGADASRARFTFRNRDGLTRSRTVSRHPDQVKTGRFYVPMTGLWDRDIETLEVEIDADFGLSPRLSACFGEAG